jgi:hypothetical protein
MSRQFVYGAVLATAMTVGLGAQSTTPQSYPQGDKPQPSSQGTEKGTTRQRTHDTGRGQMVTLVGCLESGSQSMTGTSGTSATNPSGTATGSSAGAASGSTANRGATSSDFVLTNATQSSTAKSGTSATGTSGTAASTSSIPSTLHLMASGNSSANWSRYLNHRVEVKGTLDNSMGSSMSDMANPSATTPSTNPSSTTPNANPSSTTPANPSTAGNQPPTGAATMSGSDMGAMFRVVSIKEVAGTCNSK